MKKSLKRIQQYFTLIELLVVIAILAVLISLLQPVLRKTMYTARIVKCAKNLNQITIGLLVYADDFNDHYPSIRTFRSPNNATDMPHRELMSPYWSDAPEVFICDQGVSKNPNKIYYGFYYNQFFVNHTYYQNWWGIKYPYCEYHTSCTHIPIPKSSNMNMAMRRVGESWTTMSGRQYNILASDYVGQSGFNQIVATNHTWGGDRRPGPYAVRNNHTVGTILDELTANFATDDGSVRAIKTHRNPYRNANVIDFEQIDSDRLTHVPIELSQ